MAGTLPEPKPRTTFNVTPLLAILELVDYVVIAAIVLFFAGSASFAARQRLNVSRLERKLDALLRHHGVQMPPSRLSPEVQLLAKDPTKKIAAIKLHRQQNPGLSLADAKAEVEE